MQINLWIIYNLLFILDMKLYVYAYTVFLFILLFITALNFHMLLDVPGAISSS